MLPILLNPIQAPAELPFLSPAFGSHMVLQRDKPNKIWGWTRPGERVTVKFGGRTASATADRDGKWLATIQPPRQGGPYTVQIDGSQHVTLEDVLVGDVWLCTGQSNMEMGVGEEKDAAKEIAAANDPNLRIFIVPKVPALTPQPTFPTDMGGAVWRVVTPENIVKDGWGGFSAVGYHFGETLREKTKVPIGLIANNWGGTNAESWISRENLKRVGDFDRWFPTIDAEIAKGVHPADGSDDPGSQPGNSWAAPDLDMAGWSRTRVPNGFSDLGLDNFDGTAWLRRDIELTPDQARQGATLSLGNVDDKDVTYINGQQVGAMGNVTDVRVYKIAPGVLKPGRNVIAVRVLDTGGGGGIIGDPANLSLAFDDGTKLPLAGDWMGRKGVALPMLGPNVPTALSNGMIEPYIPMAIKGAIWYQGENNASRALQYQRVLPTMIADWRQRFGQGDFPFYIVSLAAFMPHHAVPNGGAYDDAWAELREAQDLTSQRVKNSGLAISIDVGDAADIHPKDKRTVGERLALIALNRDYGFRNPYHGPTYKSMQVEGSAIRIRFDNAVRLRTTRPETMGNAESQRAYEPGEFAIAGADHKWYPATAKIDGATVVVSSPQVPNPVAVRYAWQANPVANLYNGAGLPAVPFRTDDWPLTTANNR